MELKQFKLDMERVLGVERTREEIIHDVVDKCKHVKNIEVLQLEVLLDIRDGLKSLKEPSYCKRG